MMKVSKDRTRVDLNLNVQLHPKTSINDETTQILSRVYRTVKPNAYWFVDVKECVCILSVFLKVQM